MIVKSVLLGPLIPMIISDEVTISIMHLFSEEKIMSILKAIFQAIGQAVAWIIPISESGHSAIFHDFAGRLTNACSQLTGVIHIGIAVGIVAALYKLFFKLFLTFFGELNDLFHKRIQLKPTTSGRSFMYMIMLSFVPMVFYLIPAGRYGNLYSVFHRASYDGNLLGEGICMALLGTLLIVVSSLINKRFNPLPKWCQSLVLGIIVFFAVPTPGCSLVGAVICVGILVGMSPKYALRYSMVMSVMVLIVTGIIEICVGVTSVTVLQVIFALVFSVLTAFFAVKALIFILNKNQIKHIAVYDISIGAICFIIGIFEILVRN